MKDEGGGEEVKSLKICVFCNLSLNWIKWYFASHITHYNDVLKQLRIIKESDINFDKKYVHIYDTNPSKDLSTNWSLTI